MKTNEPFRGWVPGENDSVDRDELLAALRKVTANLRSEFEDRRRCEHCDTPDDQEELRAALESEGVLEAEALLERIDGGG